MILNTTNKPYHQFTASQVLACNGSPVLHHPFTSIEDFVLWYDRFGKGISAVIVDPSPYNIVRNNDICNAVSCNVVTLDVCIDVETGKHTFIDYE